MTTISTCPDSLCGFRNSFGYCTRTGGCVFTNKTVEAPTQKEEILLKKTLTPDIIRQEFMGCVRDLLIWETPDEGEASQENKTRALFYIQGAYDLAEELIKKLEGKG